MSVNTNYESNEPSLDIVKIPAVRTSWVPWHPCISKKDSPVLYIVGTQAPILLKRDYPVHYITGTQARHHHLHLSLNREGRWGTTDDFTTSFFHLSLYCQSETWRTPGLSVPRCCLPSSSFVRLVFFPISLCLARWFWPDLMNGKHDHTTAVCVSLRRSGGLHVVRLPADNRTTRRHH